MLKTRDNLFVFLLSVALSPASFSQKSTNNFRHLTPNDGLSNEAVRGLAQDKYGFIWLGTQFGLNRFDGIHIKSWFNDPADSTSLPNNFVRSMYGDNRGRVWIGGDPGFCQYNYDSDNFIRYGNSNFNMIDIDGDKQGNIWIATNRGLKRVDTVRHTLVNTTYDKDTLVGRLLTGIIRDVHCAGDDKLYLATPGGVVIYDPLNDSASLIKGDAGGILPGSNVSALTTDHAGNLWVACQYLDAVVVRIGNDRKTVKLYNEFRRDGGKFTPNTVLKLFTDKKGRIWAGSTYWGLTGYDASADTFVNYFNDPFLPNSVNSNHAISFLHDRSGVLWIGTEGFGVNYLNPDHDIFQVVQRNQYMAGTLPDNWTRAFAEDGRGRLWVATSKGLVALNTGNEVVQSFTNDDAAHKDLHSLSVRAVMTDNKDDIWIGTAGGVNRYRPATGKMDFYGADDSISTGFTWFVQQLRSGRIVVGNNAGLYEYLPSQDKFYYYGRHPELGKYNYGLRCFREDSKGHWWIGTFAAGIIVYDPVSQKVVKHLQRDSSRTGLPSNFIHDIVEDRKGNMWIATRYKLACYSQVKDSTEIYSINDGLPSNWLGGILIDEQDRLWLSSNKGLCVIDARRKVIKSFGLQDGLLTTQFTDQPGYRTRDGRFIFPSMKGFLVFNPALFNWKDSLPSPYITSFTVLGKKWEGEANLEDIQQIRLGSQENFFSIGMIGLQYDDPEHTWYAYKLEGFDDDWVYTQERTADYTNVPGGHYTFRYKTTNNPNNWNVEEKTISILIDTVFYKTWWFRLIVIVSLITAIGLIYRYRIRQKERLLRLENKAQLLEKEKALVMYENLKQQLNPHFLFNSLTSLGSLIRVDQKIAGEFLDSLSKTYRYILKSRDSEMVPLIDELRFTETYTRLQQTRFAKGFVVRVRVAEEYHHHRIAPVTLQNLVENAIKHNIIDEDSPLVIDIYVEDNDVVVRNNLQRKNFVETSNKQGLQNLQSLYRYLSDRAVVIRETAEFFMVRIPLL